MRHRLARIMAEAMTMSMLVVACASPDSELGSENDQPRAPEPKLVQPTITEVERETATVHLGVESWNTDAKASWEDVIIPAFEASNPGITVDYLATNASSYDEELRARLDSGQAADIISCRSFDRSLILYNSGHLLELTGLDTQRLKDEAFRAWSSPDGLRRYCVPVSSVVQGFVYNIDLFDELGLETPTTAQDFADVLEAFRRDGRYVPLAIGLEDPWRIGNLAVHILGPGYWGADEGRERLVAGELRLNDPVFIDMFSAIEQWGSYLPEAANFVDADTARELFRFGDAAIYPAGSWEIGQFDDLSFRVGAFEPPIAPGADRCAVIDHPDLGLGINPASENKVAAREFIEWATTEEFGTLYANSLTGQFSLQSPATEIANPLANEFDSWRTKCDTSLRLTARGLAHGPTNIERELWDAASAVAKGEISPTEAADMLDEDFGSWHLLPTE